MPQRPLDDKTPEPPPLGAIMPARGHDRIMGIFIRKIRQALSQAWFRSVRRQVALTFTLGFSLLTALFVYFLLHEQHRFYDERSTEQARHIAVTLAASSTSWVLANDLAGLQEVLQAAASYPDVRYVMVLSPQGRVLAHSDPQRVGQYAADTPSRALLQGAAGPTLVARNATLLDYAAPIVARQRPIGWVRIGLGSESFDANMRDITYYGLLYLLLSVALGALLGLIVARRLTGGLYKLTQLTRKVRAGRRELRVRMRYQDEIATLGDDINRMLDTLEQSEEKFSKISTYAHDAIITIDQDGRITGWNPAASAMFGYERDAVLGQDLHQLLAPDTAKAAAASGLGLFRASGNGPALGKTLELSALRSDGEEFPIELSVSPVRIGENWHAIGIVRDISARRQAEAMRRQLSAIVSSSREAIIGKDLDGLITSWNEGAERLYGYSAAEMLGQPVTRLAPPEYKQEVAMLIAGVLAGKVVENHETERLRKDGSRLHVALTLSPIRDEAGQMVGVSTIARDITDRKRAELALLQSEHSLAEAQRIAHLGNWEWDIASGGLRWSDEIYRIFGLSPQQFDATYAAFLERVHPDDRQLVSTAVEAALQQRTPYSIDHRIVLPDGRLRHVHEQGEVSFDAAGQPLRMLGTVQDITQQKEAELAMQRLNRALRTISRCNEVLVHARSEAGLLQQMCDTIVRVGGLQAAWVDFIEHRGTSLSLRRAALASTDAMATDAMPCTARWTNHKPDCCPTAMTAYAGESTVVQDMHRPDSTSEPWRSEAIAHGYAATLALPLKHAEQTFGVLTIHSASANAFNEDEVRLIRELADDLAFGILSLRTRDERDSAMQERQRNLDRLRTSLEDAIQAIATTVEMRDPYTAGHQHRVADLAAAIAREMGLDEEEVHGIHLAASVHDLGKISVPAEILSKPSALTALEYGLIQTHPQVGYDILKNIDFPWPLAEMVLQHHERMDGSGYPQRLHDNEILPGARIIAVADVVEAMASHRPYRPGKGMQAALAEIERGCGTAYDAAVADACLRLFREKGYVLINPSAQRP